MRGLSLGVSIGGRNAGGSPQSFFLNGEDGVFFDFTDIGTLFQSPVAATAISAAGQTLGLALDTKSGARLSGGQFNATGAELNASGSWTTGTGWSHASGTLTSTGANAFAQVSKSISTVANKFYVVSIVVTRTSGSLLIRLGDGTNRHEINASGTYNLVIFSGGTSGIAFVSNAPGFEFVGTISAISVKELFGRHAIQSTAAARVTYRQTGSGRGYVENVSSDVLQWTAAAGDYDIAFVDNAGAVTIYTEQALSGATTILRATNIGGYLAINRRLTSGEMARLAAYWNARFGGAGYTLMPNIFVDNAGSDANDGRTEATAVQTIAQAETLAAVKGSAARIGLKRGGIWREELSPTDGQIVTAYGSGAKPILNGSDIITGWTLTATRTFTYEKAVTCGSAAISSSVFVRAFEDDTTPLVRQTSIALVEANPGSYFAAGTHPNYTIYIHPTDSANPNSNGKDYEVTTRLYGLGADVNEDDISVRDIQCEKSCHIDGSLVLRGRRITVRDCDALHGSKHNWLVGSGTVTGGRAAFAEWTSSKTLGVFYRNEPSGDTILCDGMEFEWTLADLTAFNNMSALLAHIGGSATTEWGSATVRNCVATYCSGAWNIGGCSEVLIEDCQSVDCREFSPVNENTTISGGSATTTIELTNVVFTFTAGKKLTIRNGFTVNMARSNVGYIFLNSSADNCEIDIDGMEFDGTNKTSYSTAIFADSGASSLLATIRNTDFRGVDRMYGFPSDTDFTSDENTVSSGVDNTIGGASYTDFASYRTATGQDANSTVA